MVFELETINIIVTIILGLILAINTFSTKNRNSGIEQGVLLNDIDYVKRGIDDVRFEQRDSSRKIEHKIDKINDTVIRHDSEIKQLQELTKNK